MHNVDDTVGETTRSWMNFTNINATECGLDLCVKKYRSVMNSTVLSEQLLDTFIDTESLKVFTEYGLQGVTIEAPSSFTGEMNIDGANTYSTTNESMNAIHFMFNAEGGEYFWHGEGQNAGDGVNDFFTTDIARLLRKFDLDGLSILMESIAASMTKRMREAPGSEKSSLGDSAVGTLYQHVPFVNVRWAWITYPALLVFLALMFLVVTIIENAREGAMLWKSNSLANFYHPLTKDGRDELQNGHNAEEAVEIAEKMKVKWARTEAGVRLVQRHET